MGQTLTNPVGAKAIRSGRKVYATIYRLGMNSPTEMGRSWPIPWLRAARARCALFFRKTRGSDRTGNAVQGLHLEIRACSYENASPYNTVTQMLALASARAWS